MTTTTFGKRGLAQPAANGPPRFQAASGPSAIGSATISSSGAAPRAARERTLVDNLPIMTVLMIAALLFIFYGVEQRLAFSIGKTGELDLESLIALGGASYYRVVDDGQWWRVFLAPLLHASPSHVIGNSIAMFLVGLRLEAIIGRAWLAATFVVSALGGAAGSLLGNDHLVTTVGASGAITGMVGALFVACFHCAANATQLRRMLWTAGLLGVPALGPLAYGASGHTDYFCHSGGAVAGGSFTLLMLALWTGDRFRPNYRGAAALTAAIGLVVALASCLFAWNHFAGEAAEAARFIPGAEVQDSMNGDSKKAFEFLRRYPDDPRSHIAEAMVYLRREPVSPSDLSSAEAELRTAMTLEGPIEVRRQVKNLVQFILATVVSEQGRAGEAQAIASGLCHARDGIAAPLLALLDKSKLCD
jgi:membrane associated rhomboid family serine protease